ncbi:hypothetical protein [Marinobacter fonticola]|uniref:hypothetical protein n=1 Tax=Marinobacter fonticola TaxID=2603215 RepID=UPI0011E8926C|nr:hypothetical protein [Marinobacter fonticola]
MNAMVKDLALIALFAALFTTAGWASADAQFLSVADENIPDAMALSRSLDAVMDDATTCRQENRELSGCLCGKQSIETMSATYERMIDKHPEWAGKTLRFDADNTSHAIQLPTYKQELQRIQNQCG